MVCGAMKTVGAVLAFAFLASTASAAVVSVPYDEPAPTFVIEAKSPVTGDLSPYLPQITWQSDTAIPEMGTWLLMFIGFVSMILGRRFICAPP